jgi:hypothetical protein
VIAATGGSMQVLLSRRAALVVSAITDRNAAA